MPIKWAQPSKTSTFRPGKCDDRCRQPGYRPGIQHAFQRQQEPSSFFYRNILNAGGSYNTQYLDIGAEFDAIINSPMETEQKSTKIKSTILLLSLLCLWQFSPRNRIEPGREKCPAYMREEEKPARMYTTQCSVKWDAKPFGNIRQSERCTWSG